MTRHGAFFGSMLPEALLEEVGRLPEVIRERELSTARRAVHWVLAMFECTIRYWTAWCSVVVGPLASPTLSVMSSRKTVPPSPTA
jgi:hypothetical protein